MIDYLKIMLDARLEKMEERGASAVEYGLLIAAIAVAIMLVVFTLGGKIRDMFDETCAAIGNSGQTGGSC